MEEEKQPQKKELIHDINSKDGKGFLDSKKLMEGETLTSIKKPLIFVIAVMLVLGVATGYITSSIMGAGKKGPVSSTGSEVSGGEIKKGYKVGVEDAKQFPDTAEGDLKEGGVDGEGEYHLERPGGVSQNVYLTSSTIDLSQFVGKKVKIWGQTFTAEKAGWLMDVGRLEVL